MAEKKILGLRPIIEKDGFGKSLETTLRKSEETSALAKDTAERVRAATNLLPVAEKSYRDLLEKGEKPKDAFMKVLQTVYGALLFPKDLKEGGFEIFAGIVQAHGGSKSLERTMAELGREINVGVREKAKERVQKLNADKKKHEADLANLEKTNTDSETRLKPLDDLLDKREEIFGHDGDLDKALERTQLQKSAYETFEALQALENSIKKEPKIEEQWRKIKDFLTEFRELLSDKGDESRLRKKWGNFWKNLPKIQKLVDSRAFQNALQDVVGSDVNGLRKRFLESAEKLRTGLSIEFGLTSPESFDAEAMIRPSTGGGLRELDLKELRDVFAFPQYREDAELKYEDFKSNAEDILSWMEKYKFPGLVSLNRWAEKFKRLNEQNESNDFSNVNIDEIEDLVDDFDDAELKKEMDGLQGFYNYIYLTPENALDPSILNRHRLVIGGLPQDIEAFRASYGEFEESVRFIRDLGAEGHFSGKYKPDFSENAEVVQVTKVHEHMNAVHGKLVELVADAPLMTATFGDALGAKITKFNNDYETLKVSFKFPPDDVLSPTLAELEKWLEENYYPLEKDLIASRATRKEVYEKSKDGLTEALAKVKEELGEIESPLVTALKEKVPTEVQVTENQLFAALLREVGVMVNVKTVDGKDQLLLFGEDPAKVLSENGRKRMLAALKKAQQALANCDKAELLSDGAKIEALDTSGINESLKRAIDSDSESPKDVVVSDTSALTDEVDRLTRLKKTIAAPTDPIPAMAASKNATKELLDGATADYNKRFKSHAELQNKLDGAIGQLQRAKEMATKLFVGLKPVCEGLKLAKSLGVSDKLLPKDSTGAPILDGILEKFNEVAAKEGVFSLADIGKLKKLFESLREYLTGDTLNLLADSLDDSQKAIDSFGKKPDALAEALEKAALQLMNPGLTEEEANQGARAIKKADRLAASGVMTPEERADFLRAKKYDVLTNERFKEWYKAVRFKRGDKEVSLESIVGDVADFNDLAKLGKLLATAKLKDHELASIYTALRSAGGGVVNEQMKMIFETLVERALNDPAAKREARKSNLSEQERLEAAQSYAKAQIAANEGEAETSGFFERADSRAKENKARNDEMFKIEAKLLNLQIASEEIPKLDYQMKMRRLVKKYEQGVKGAKFYEFRWNKMKENAKTSAKAAVAAAPELLVRKTGALALKALGWGWNKTLGRNKLKVDTSNVAKFIGGSAKDIYNRDKEFIKKNISHAVEIEMLNEKLEELKKEGEDAKRSMVVADEGIKAPDFFIKASNDDVEVAAAA